MMSKKWQMLCKYLQILYKNLNADSHMIGSKFNDKYFMIMYNII